MVPCRWTVISHHFAQCLPRSSRWFLCFRRGKRERSESLTGRFIQKLFTANAINGKLSILTPNRYVAAMRTSDFHFHLPPKLIAQQPTPLRDQSRLLVLHRASGRIEHRQFLDLPDFLRAG